MSCTGCGGDLQTPTEYRTATCQDCLDALQDAADDSS